MVLPGAAEVGYIFEGELEEGVFAKLVVVGPSTRAEFLAQADFVNPGYKTWREDPYYYAVIAE